MTQEDKELLLKDLCARLPYGVVCEFKRSTLNVLYNNIYDDTLTINNIGYILKDDSIVRPYLRPMSSMTEEECIELGNIKATIENISEVIPNVPYYIEVAYSKQIDWLNAHHFDYRTDDEGKTMIKKGLALEATERMYN